METTRERSTLSTVLDWSPLTLGPGDVIRVGVYGHPELSSLPHATTAAGTRIDNEGNLSLPLIGAVHVDGLRVSEASTKLTEAFGEFVEDPRLDVSVIEYGARRFYVLGEVPQPGPIVMDRPLNLFQAASQAGGFTPRADRERIVLLRGTPDDLEVHQFSIDDPDEAGFVTIQPDDLLIVRRSGAGRFSDEVLPYLQGVASTLSSVATVLLIEDRLSDD